MKKYFYSLLAATGLLLATSCSQDDLVNETGSESKVVTFKVNLPDQATSRAVGDGTKATELIFAMYEEDSDTPLIRKKISDTDDGNNTADGKFTVSVPMAKDIKYDLLFLAYNPDNCAFKIDESDPAQTNLKALKFKNKLTANLDAYDAFVGVKKSQGITASGTNSVPLTRPFAQVNAATSDTGDAALLKSTVTKSEFCIYGVPSTYNVFEGEATDTMDVVFEKSAIPANETIIKDGTTYNYLTLAYVLAGCVDQTSTHKAEFLFYREDGKQVSSLYFENFPIQRNYRTNVLGNLLTQVEDYTVTIHKGFEGTHSADPDEANRVYTVTDPEGWAEVAAILESSGEDTISVKLGAGMGRAASNEIAVTIPTTIHKDKTVFLDLNGYTLSQTISCDKHYGMITNNGVLTIVDSSEGATGKISFKDTGNGDSSFGWGSYTIVNSGTLVVESGTIENLSQQNVGQDVVHMYCAIQQSGGTTTINGGVISTPTYRSLRVNNGTATINGGHMDGQVWMQPYSENTGITINGGKFNPNGPDGSSVFVGNEDKEVALSVTGGEFATRIGCSNVAKLAKTVTGGTFNDASVLNYLADGADIKFGSNVVAPENTTFVVPSGMTVSIDLNEHVLSSTNTRTATHNFFIDVKGGTLNLKNGRIEYQHTGTNMEWNGATTVIDITAGGVLNTNDVVVNSLGGTDMNFAIHMNNWGEVTLNADNCEFLATYCGVRVFNSGFDNNNVTIKNSKLTGASRAFWVHNYIGDLDSSKHSDNAINERLKLDIYNNNNRFEITGNAVSLIRYGFGTSVYFNENGYEVISDGVFKATANQYYISNAAGLKWMETAVNNGNSFKGCTITLMEDIDLENQEWTPIGTSTSKMFYGTFDGNGKMINNLKVTREEGYGNAFFGNLASNSVVKNVTFKKAHVQKGTNPYSGNAYGIVAAYVYGSCTFENVHVLESELHGYGKVGAILGMNGEPGNHTVTVKGCSVKSTKIYAVYNVSPIIGLVQKGNKVVTDNVIVGDDVEWIQSEGNTYVELDSVVAKEKDGNGQDLTITGHFWVYKSGDEIYLYAGYAPIYNDYEIGHLDYRLEDGRAIAHGTTH